MEIILIILCLNPGIVYTMDPPVYKWPLNDKTFGFEVLNRFDAIIPRLDQCFPINPNGNLNLNTHSTLTFDGSTKSLVDVPIDGSIPFHNSVSLSLYVKPTQIKTRSVVFHYKSQMQVPNKITDIILEGNLNNYMVTLIFGNGISCSSVAFDKFVVNTLELVTSRYKYDQSKMSISFESGPHIKDAYRGQLSLPGTLRFGGHQSDFGSNFVGELSCATMYNTDNNIGTVAAIRNYCNMNYQNPPSVPTCFDFPAEQKLVWPMDDVAYGYEVIHGIAPSFYYRIQYDTIESPSSLANRALSFDGSYICTLITRIPFSILQGEFDLMFFINFHDICDGTIISISSNNDSMIGIHKLHLAVYNSTLILEVFDQSSVCAELVVANPVISLHWHSMAIQRFQNQVHLIIDGQEYGASESCSTGHGFENNTITMAIGTTYANEEGFKGSIRCMALYNTIHPINGISAALVSVCMSNEVASFSPPTGATSLPLDKYVKFLRIAERCPPSKFPTLLTAVDSSLTSCGKLCIDNDHCRTFLYDKSRNCKLYGYFIVNALKYCPQTNYYSFKEIT